MSKWTDYWNCTADVLEQRNKALDLLEECFGKLTWTDLSLRVGEHLNEMRTSRGMWPCQSLYRRTTGPGTRGIKERIEERITEVEEGNKWDGVLNSKAINQLLKDVQELKIGPERMEA